ncbi:polyketide synthase [Dentipellis sp. KUC8613]|nr:polyketide synthase [Dentipellis sp. KUC8613]
MTSSPSTQQHLNVPVFAGHGTTAINSPQTRERASRDASSASGSLLLSACYDAFQSELASLSEAEAKAAGVDSRDFDKPELLLSLPQERYLSNPIISGITLFLVQTLRYLAFIESYLASTSQPFASVLASNRAHSLGVLGFSSGILPACVVGTSISTLEFITNAVQVFRLVFWIGVRAQLYKVAALESVESLGDDAALPWSLVFLGMGRQQAEDAVKQFSDTTPAESLHVTAVMDDSCVTVSGRPDVLAAFASSLQTSAPPHKTTVDTLYHSPAHVGGVRDTVLADVSRRGIRFPAYSDIKVPIRSMHSGQLLGAQNEGSLVEAVVDMVLTQSVNWDLVVAALVAATPEGEVVRLINVGPGAGLTRSMERAFPLRNVFSVDLTVPESHSTTSGSSPIQEPIAIVGMAVNMPGAPSASKLWEVLESGINTIAEIPEHRFSVSDYNNPADSKSARSMKAHTGNFLDDPDAFDNKFFKISPREARSMDPQGRVLLHTAYEALENAGYVPGATPTFNPETFGCYVGCATGDYVQNLRNEIDVYYSTGTLRAFLSGRISYAMKLSGPSVVIDTACSSSLVAVYQACRALMNRDCNAAMAGGVNVITSPDMFLGLDRGHFLSPTGQCKAFDASADGYSRSEGCGIFVLKRLSDAVAEHDNIMGVIRGVEVNQSGLAHSITHPHPPTQEVLFKQVLDKTGIDPRRINVVEAHGTGTQAGDPNELESIRGIFAVGRTAANPLHITSVKANIGHLEAASGAAGLAKLLLMLEHRTIPRQISLKNLNPKIIALDKDHTVIDREHAPWNPSQEGLPRLAMLNNFGAAGSNGTIILEEYVPKDPSTAQPEAPAAFVVGMSAKTPEALDELRSRYMAWLKSDASAQVSLADFAYTATARRQLYDHRSAVAASSKEELVEKLSTATTSVVSEHGGKVAFVFSGQGSQYLGMGSSLYKTVPAFKRTVDECQSILTAAGFPGVLAIINPAGETSGLTQLEEFEAYQASIFTLEYALAKLWMSWGITPSVVVGHSLGEYAAQVIAGVLTLKGALTLIANRVRFMVTKCAVETTGMIAINRGSEAIAELLASSKGFPDTTVACFNSNTDCVASGPIEQLKLLKGHLDSEVKCKNVLLTVPFGYHSAAMHPVLEALTTVAKHVTIRAPTIPIISNVLGEVVLPGDDSAFTTEYYSRHCAEPVQFEKGITSLSTYPELSRVDAWIEIGPHTTTLPMLKVHPAVSKSTMLLGSIRKQQDAWATLSATLAQLYTSGVDVKWREVFAHLSSPSCVALPSYPFAKGKFWVAWKEDAPGAAPVAAAPEVKSAHLVDDFSMLYSWAQFPCASNQQVAIFETPISLLAKSIQGHSVGDHPLCPASVYHELALAGIETAKTYLQLSFDESYVTLRDIDYAKPLVYNASVPRVIKTSITLNHDGSGSFSVGSQVGAAAEEVHCFGNFKYQSTPKTVTKFSRVLPIVTRQIAAVSSSRDGLAETFSTRTAYEVIFPRVVDYAKEYHTMKTLTVSFNGMEAYAIVQLPRDHDRSKFVVHPVFMDTMLHVAGFVANMQGGVNDAFICSKVDNVKAIPSLIDNDAEYGVFISNAWVAEEGVMLADAYAVQIQAPGKIVAHLKGMHFRKVRLNSLKRGLAMAAGGETAPKRAEPPVRKAAPVVSQKAAFVEPPRAPAASTIDILAEVTRIVAETCDISASNIQPNGDLESYGVDSLMSIEIFGKLQTVFPNTDLDAHVLSSCRNVASIVAEVSSKFSPEASGPSSPRTLVTDDKLPEPSVTAIFDDVDVKPLLASVLGIGLQEITDDADFESLGLDSLTSIEAHHALQEEYSLQLPQTLFETHTTAKAVNAFIMNQLRPKGKSPEKAPHVKFEQDVKPAEFRDSDIATAAKVAQIVDGNLNPLVTALRLDSVPIEVQKATTPGRAPLFLIHDGSGLVLYIRRLSPLDRDIWGIHNPHFITSQPWESVVSMAAEYSEFATKTTSEPLLLGGWSFGGVVAFEAARQLMKKGVAVKGVLLIDSPSPVNHVPLSDALLDSVAKLDGRNAGTDIGRLVKTQFQMNSRMLGRYDPLAAGGPFPPIVLLRSSEGFNPAGVSDVPKWLADRSDRTQAAAGWEKVVGTSIKVLDIPGHHFQPFHPDNIGEISRRIAEGCAHLEQISA